MGTVIIEGFIIDFYVPSEELLNITVDVSRIARSHYMDFKEQLEDMLRDIDEKWAERKTRRRTLRARYTTLPNKVRSRILRFTPYPSRFSNELKTFRANWYKALRTNTLILGKIPLTYSARNLYLVPLEKAPDLVLAKDEFNLQLKRLRKEVRRYERTKDFEAVFSYLNENLRERVEKVECELPDMHLDLHQIRLDPAVFERYVESKGKEVLRKLDEERREAFQRLRNEVEETRRRVIEIALTDLQSRLGAVMKVLTVELLNLDVAKKLRKNIEEIKSLAESVHLETVMMPLIEADMKMIDAIIGGDEKRFISAANSLGEIFNLKRVESISHAVELVKHCSIKMSEGLSPRVKQMLKEIL